MSVILRAWTVFLLGIKRLNSDRCRTAATILGMILVVALTTSIPIYSDAVNHRALVEEFSSTEYGDRPPFAFLFRCVGEDTAKAGWTDVWSADRYATEQAGDDLGLPQRGIVRYLATKTFYLFPQDDLGTSDSAPLAWARFAFASDLSAHVDVLRGSFPAAAMLSRKEPVGVLIGEALAEKSGLDVGDELLAYAHSELDVGQQDVQISVYVAGVWRASDPEDEYWFYNAKVLEDIMFVPESTLVDLVGSAEIEPSVALWYLLMDGSGVFAEDVDLLLTRLGSVQDQMASHLPGTSLVISPEQALLTYRQSTGALLFSLHVSSLPILALFLIFVGAVTQQAMERRRYETAVLYCRGASLMQVAGIALLERVVFAGLALVIGLPVGGLIARLMGQARGLLDFSMTQGLRIGWTATAVRMGVAAAGLAFVIQVFPVIGASRRTVTAYKHERARMMRWPWWHRAWPEPFLLVLVAYGYYMTERQSADPFRTPLFLLVPVLGMVAVTLLVLRVLPLILSVVAWLASLTRGLGLFLAARNLGRRPALYAAPLTLLTLTLSLSTFVASLGTTLDAQLHSRVYYDVGADMVVRELSERTEKEPYRPYAPPEGEGSAEEQRWVFRWVTDYLRVDGVEAAARVGRYSATARSKEGAHSGEFLGVDYWDFDAVAYWQDGFSSASLESLMDDLSARPNGVLVSTDFLHDHGLAIGDILEMRVLAYGGVSVLEMEIVGTFDAFPTWHRGSDSKGALFVGNLHYLFYQMGTQLPHDVWLRVAPGTDCERVIEGVRALGVSVLAWEASSAKIAEAQQSPERQGLYGLLSVAVPSAVALSGIGLLLHVASSFRRRFVEWGVLRAIGVPSKQMVAVLTWELCLLLLAGVVIGTVLGLGGSHLFITYLQPEGDMPVEWPSRTVQVAWPTAVHAWVVCGLLFATSHAVLIALARRIKVSRVIKAGEAA